MTHPMEQYLAEQAAKPGATMTITKAAYAFLLEQLRAMEQRAEAAQPVPPLDWTFAMLAVSIAIHQDNPPADRFSCQSCREIVGKARAILALAAPTEPEHTP